MGEKITRGPKSTDLVRAKLLKQALQQGSPPTLLDPGTELSSPPESISANWNEESREVQQAFLEQLVECTPEALSILDPRYRVTRINAEFTRVFGYSPEEALGKRIDELIVPPDRSAETCWIGETLAKGEKVTLETKRQRKDGTQVDVCISTAPVIIGGRQAAIYALYRDISDQKRAEALSSALYRIAERTSSAEDLQQFYAAMHNIVGELMNARNFYIALYDPVTQLLSFPYFVDEEDPTPAPKKLGRGLTEYVLRTGEPLLATPRVFDELVLRGEVTLIGAPSVDWMGVPLKIASNTFGVLVVQSYTDNVRFGERDRDILTFVSQQLASAIEHKGNEEVLALAPKKDIFLNPEEQSRLMKEFRRNGRLDSIEVQWRRKDGSPITVRLSGRAVTGIAEPEEVLEIIAEDVTERRVLEDQFRQAQKMEAVGRLAGGVAHDFNNLLMVIGGYTEVLLEQMEPTSTMYQKALAVQQAADRATTLTRQLLAFSRKQLLELKVVDVNAIVSDMERLLRPLIGENIELTTKLSTGLGRTRADAGQLEQVIMNLVVNAKDAMPDGGKITIHTANVTLDGALRREHTFIHPGSYVLISVTDTGLGMDKETQSRIFEPFFTTKEKGKGTGLGLSTVYGIVKQSGGYVFAQSEVGQGTTFRIYLPQVEDAADTIGPAKTASTETGGSETVLLVEDEESVRQTLESKGYTVMEAENGEEGLKIAESHNGPIHMMITDVVMPGISGRELAKRLMQVRPETKVLYLSGYTEDAIVHQGVLETGTAFLQKPFTLQTLSRKVREVLRGDGS